MKSKQPQQSEVPIQPAGVPNVENAPSQFQRELEREEHLAIATRSHELFEARGCEGGHESEDWLRAQSELHLQE